MTSVQWRLRPEGSKCTLKSSVSSSGPHCRPGRLCAAVGPQAEEGAKQGEVGSEHHVHTPGFAVTEERGGSCGRARGRSHDMGSGPVLRVTAVFFPPKMVSAGPERVWRRALQSWPGPRWFCPDSSRGRGGSEGRTGLQGPGLQGRTAGESDDTNTCTRSHTLFLQQNPQQRFHSRGGGGGHTRAVCVLHSRGPAERGSRTVLTTEHAANGDSALRLLQSFG